VKLHIGSGDKPLPGWVNVDRKPLPGVDVVTDVTQGLQFLDVEAIFAEHFLEHLGLDDALGFLLEAHRVLLPWGSLRLSTPNLDWVWHTHYVFEAPEPVRRLAVLHANRAFHAWGHRFLWNAEMLTSALGACGFAELTWCRYGNSLREVFRAVEHHEAYADAPDLPHVLIVEAVKGEPRPTELAALRELIHHEFVRHLDP
jgi:hypothetical protein